MTQYINETGTRDILDILSEHQSIFTTSWHVVAGGCDQFHPAKSLLHQKNLLEIASAIARNLHGRCRLHIPANYSKTSNEAMKSVTLTPLFT